MEKKSTIQEQLGRLESIANILEEGEATIEESLKLFEEGMKLIAKSEETLAKMESKIVTLTRNGEEKPFTGESINEF